VSRLSYFEEQGWLLFNILVGLYAFGPFILVPLWAYHERNWWLLIGILISRLSTRAAPRFLEGYGATSIWSGKRDLAVTFLVILSVVLSLIAGLHSYLTFFSLSALWGFLLFHMAERAQNQYAVKSLIESPELFYSAVEHSKIMVVDVEKERKKQQELENA
jgi:phosphatidylglycerophosphate synthase